MEIINYRCCVCARRLCQGPNDWVQFDQNLVIPSSNITFDETLRLMGSFNADQASGRLAGCKASSINCSACSAVLGLRCHDVPESKKELSSVVLIYRKKITPVSCLGSTVDMNTRKLEEIPKSIGQVARRVVTNVPNKDKDVPPRRALTSLPTAVPGGAEPGTVPGTESGAVPGTESGAVPGALAPGVEQDTGLRQMVLLQSTHITRLMTMVGELKAEITSMKEVFESVKAQVVGQSTSRNAGLAVEGYNGGPWGPSNAESSPSRDARGLSSTAPTCETSEQRRESTTNSVHTEPAASTSRTSSLTAVVEDSFRGSVSASNAVLRTQPRPAQGSSRKASISKERGNPAEVIDTQQYLSMTVENDDPKDADYMPSNRTPSPSRIGEADSEAGRTRTDILVAPARPEYTTSSFSMPVGRSSRVGRPRGSRAAQYARRGRVLDRVSDRPWTDNLSWDVLRQRDVLAPSQSTSPSNLNRRGSVVRRGYSGATNSLKRPLSETCSSETYSPQKLRDENGFLIQRNGKIDGRSLRYKRAKTNQQSTAPTNESGIRKSQEAGASAGNSIHIKEEEQETTTLHEAGPAEENDAIAVQRQIPETVSPSSSTSSLSSLESESESQSQTLQQQSASTLGRNYIDEVAASGSSDQLPPLFQDKESVVVKQEPGSAAAAARTSAAATATAGVSSGGLGHKKTMAMMFLGRYNNKQTS